MESNQNLIKQISNLPTMPQKLMALRARQRGHPVF